MRESNPMARRIPPTNSKEATNVAVAGCGQAEARKEFAHVCEVVKLSPAVLRDLPTPVELDRKKWRLRVGRRSNEQAVEVLDFCQCFIHILSSSRRTGFSCDWNRFVSEEGPLELKRPFPAPRKNIIG
jgi:hypothetical protein